MIGHVNARPSRARIATVDGGVIYIDSWDPHALQRRIDLARAAGATTIKLNGRRIPLARLAAVLTTPDAED